MVLPSKFFHKTSIRVSYQDSFEHNLYNTQASPPFFKANLTHEGIVINSMLISAYIVYSGFYADPDATTIYRRIKTLDNLAKPSIQTLLTFLRGFMTNILVNDTITFIPYIVFMESTEPAYHTWGLNKFNITFPTLCSSH